MIYNAKFFIVIISPKAVSTLIVGGPHITDNITLSCGISDFS